MGPDLEGELTASGRRSGLTGLARVGVVRSEGPSAGRVEQALTPHG